MDDNIYLKTIDFLTKLIFGTKSIKTIFSDINESIVRLGKPIVIFIDDLDRLDSSELVEVIKLIRVSANFKNTAFVAAYDKEYVTHALKSITEHNQNLFLEKIFQAEFHLPTFEVGRLKNYFVEELKKVIDGNFYNEINAYFSEEQFIFDRSILTLRDVKRFVNQFQIDFNQVKDEVLFSDFMNLALIKYKHFGLYEFIKKYRGKDQLLRPSVRNNSDGYLSINSSFLELLKSENNMVQDLLSEKETSQLLHKLFSRSVWEKDSPVSSSNKLLLNALNRESKIDVYFSLRLLDGKISSVEFISVRKNESLFLSKIPEWIDGGYEKDLHDKLMTIKMFESGFDYLTILKGVLIYCSKLGDLKIVSVTLEKGASFKNNIDIVEEVKNQFLNGHHNITLAFKTQILQQSLQKEVLHSQDYVLSLNDTIFLLKEMLMQELNSTKKFTDDIWTMYGNCQYTRPVLNNAVAVNEEINELILNFAMNEDTRGFFEGIIEKLGSDSYRYNPKRFNYLFPEIDEVGKFISQLTDSKLKSIMTTFNEKVVNMGDMDTSFDFEGQLDWEFEHE